MNTAASESRAASNKPHFTVCEGNEAAAIGVGLARPDVVAVYPITPQSSLVEHLSQMIADGRLKADLMNVEGEHAVMSGLQGVALAGGRTFTATCGPGLAFMFEPYVRTPGLRLPMVASLVTRDLLSPQCVWGGHQDAMVVREAGWIQMYCETVQEILDTTVTADGSRSADRRHRRGRPKQLRALSQGPMPRHAERAPSHPRSARRLGRGV